MNIIYLNGDVTVRSSDDPRDGQWNLVLDWPGAIWADESWIVHLGEGGPDEI